MVSYASGRWTVFSKLGSPFKITGRLGDSRNKKVPGIIKTTEFVVTKIIDHFYINFYSLKVVNYVVIFFVS